MKHRTQGAARGQPAAGRLLSGLQCLLLALCCLLPGLLRAQTYSSASTPFALIDSSSHSKVGHNTSPHKFVAVSGCGTTPPVLDDTLSTLIPLGFSFVFGGTAYTEAHISTNGRLQFNNTTCGAGTAALGPPQTYPYGFPVAGMNGVLKIFGVDLDPTNLVDRPDYPSAGNKTPCSSINSCYISVATLGSAPSRQFVVTWKNVPEWVTASNTSGRFDLQIILNEDGSFVFQYGTISHGGTGSAQIGWQVSTSDYQVLTFGASTEPPPNTAILFYIPAPVAAYQFEEGGWASSTPGQVADASGLGRPGESIGNAQPLASGKVCRALDIPANASAAEVDAVKTGIDLSSAALGMQGAGMVAFWFRSNVDWDKGDAAQLLDAGTADGDWFFLARQASGRISFVVTDSLGAVHRVESAPQTFSAGTWVHLAIAWNYNGLPGANQDNLRLFINGTQVAISSFTSNGTINVRAAAIHLGDNPSGFADSSGTVNSANGQFDEVQIFNYLLSAAQLGTLMAASRSCTPLVFDHLEIRHASGNGVTCTPTVLSIRACKDAACTVAYTGGLAGRLRSSGTAAVFDNSGNGRGAGFAIPAGSSSVSKGLQVTSVGSALVGVNSVTITTQGAHGCNFGNPACTLSAADSGLLFDAPDMRAEASHPLAVSAVRKSDSSNACVPAFASVSKPVTFRCSYSNPASGTRPVRIGGVALNSGNNSAAACDAGGQAVTLAFDATGTASTTVVYADAGRMALSATYSGSGSDAGLVMTGSDSFVAAPYDFAVTGISSAAIAAGSAFAATVTARNYAGAATPNFGRETAPEGATLGFVRTHPNFSGAVSGSFSGSLGAFSNGVASASNLVYSEVGQGNVSAVLASGSYLGSGQTLAGASEGELVWCANEGGSCVLPSGATVTMYYQAWGHGRAKVVSGLSGTVACNNTTFGDPEPGWGKGCVYAATSGTRGWATAAATFKPHHFDVATSAACGAFSYAGQPFGATVTARNASGATTRNYDGSVNTSPNFARTTTLSDAGALGLGSLSGNSLAAGAFLAGVATASPAYSFNSKGTAPQSLVLRATDSDAVSSAGHAEGSMPLRSGRLRLSNAFGKAGAALQLAATTEYWAGSTWQLNSADSCTTLAAASVALSNPRSATGAASTASSSAGALAITSGSGSITLAAPSPAGSSLSLDVAVNLGSGGADQSCHASHPASTGAAKPWLRAQNGSCAASADRDPAARASFGIFSPETRKTVHVRDIY